jgi:divalent metal cation (Fe/Co/Zn/Cd) transporter
MKFWKLWPAAGSHQTSQLRTRKIGYNIAVDIHIYVKRDLTVARS